MNNISPTVYNDLASLERLKAQSKDAPDAALNEAAQQFEALFTSMVLKAMRDTVPEDSLFGGSSMKTYQEMFDQQLSLDLSRRGGIGLAPLIAKQLAAGIHPERTQSDATEQVADNGQAG